MREFSRHAMSFKIAFTDKKKTVSIAQTIPFRTVRIMAGTNGIDARSYLPLS